MTESKQICGADLLRNPQLNRADAFTQEERDARGLRGLLPPAVSTMELQVKRTLALLDRCPTALDKFLMLDSLHATDEDLYFKILIDYIDDYMPVVYTPTVGEVCQKFSHIYRYPRGAFISINDKGRVREIIENCPNEEVDVIVVTDGQRILGLGDLGINGMGIPCGKLSLYTACAGIAPEKTLPVTIDVGTNNPEYLNDPMYLGLRQERVTGEAYDELIEEFVTEARRRWPNVLIQFEDFGNNHAFDLLERYKDKVLCFNDDIQGTAAVAVTGVYSALRVTKQKLADQRFLFLGAGEAATGIAELLVDAMVAEGVEREEALKHCFLFDSKGLVTCNRGDKLAHNKVPFAHDVENCKTFIEACVRPASSAWPPSRAPSMPKCSAPWPKSTSVRSSSRFPTRRPAPNATPPRPTVKRTAARSLPPALRSLRSTSTARPSCRVRATTATCSPASASAPSSPAPRRCPWACSSPPPASSPSS